MLKPLSTVLAALLAGALVATVGLADAAAAGQTNAEQISQIRDRLDTATRDQDTAAVRAAAHDLSPVLANVHQDLDRGLVPRTAADPLSAAEQQNAELTTALNPRDGIFDSIKQMIEKLVDDLKKLLQQLLGGGSGGGTKPTGPTKPGQPTKPGDPTKPGQPTQPGSPGQPGNPTQPGNPGQPGSPSQPGSPAQPPAPTGA